MRIGPRCAMGAVAALTLLAGVCVPASAQACQGAMKIIASYPPGSPDDVIARILAQKLGASGAAVVVENMPGASGRIGNAAAARAAADGCTLLVGSSNLAVHAAANVRMPYDIRTSFVPVAFLTEAPETISVHPGVPASSFQELAALLKANPGRYSYATPGFASSPHLAGESLFRHALGLDVNHVPHQGGPPAVTSTIGGHTNIVHLTVPVVAAAVKDGKLRMLAVADKRRHPMFPDVPTLAEAGIANHEIGFWNALFAPQGTPPGVVDRLHGQVSSIMGSAEVRGRLAAMGFAPMAGTQAELARHIEDDIGRMKAILERTQITVQ